MAIQTLPSSAAFQPSLNEVFLPQAIYEKAQQDPRFFLQCQEPYQGMLGNYAAQILYLPPRDHKHICQEIFQSILQTTMRWGFNYHWLTDLGRGEIEVAFEKGLFRLLFSNPEILANFKRRVIEALTLKEDEIPLVYMDLPLTPYLHSFPEFDRRLKRVRLVKGDDGKKRLSLTFYDEASQTEGSKLIRDKIEQESRKRKDRDDKQQEVSQKPVLRRLKSVCLYRDPSDNTSLILEGHILQQFDDLCHDTMQSVLGTHHRPLPEPLHLTRKGQKLIPHGFPWIKYQSVFPDIDSFVTTARITYDIGTNVLHLGCKNNKFAKEFKEIIEHRLTENQYPYLSGDIYTETTCAVHAVIVKHLAFVSLDILCHLTYDLSHK